MAATDGFYRERRALHEDDAIRMGWRSRENQRRGFAGLLALAQSAIDLRGLTAHDAGAGLGDFVPFAFGAGMVRYVGTDCLHDTVVEARGRWRDLHHVRFEVLDLLTDPLPVADVTFLHGTLAFYGPADVERMLARCWESSRRALAFRLWWGLEHRAILHAARAFMRRTAPAERRRESLGDYGLPREAAFVIVRS